MAGLIRQYVEHIRRALSDHAKEPQLCAADAAALQSAAAGAEALLGERGGEAAAAELAAKLAELEAACGPALERAKEWLKDAAPLEQYLQHIRRALSDHAREPQLSADAASVLGPTAAGVGACLGERAGESNGNTGASAQRLLDFGCEAAVRELTKQLQELLGDRLVEGQQEGELAADVMGRYELADPVHLQNGRPAWRAAGDKGQVLYFTGTRQQVANRRFLHSG
jgi:hypothetical protein